MEDSTLEGWDGQWVRSARVGDLAGLRLAIEHGVNPRMGAEDKKTALHLAAQGGHLDAVKFLMPLCDAKARDDEGVYPMSSAASSGNLEVLGAMLGRHGKRRDDVVWQALLLAMRFGQVGAAKILVEHPRSHKEQPTGSGETMLMAAACSGSVQAMRLALSWDGIDPLAIDDGGNDLFLWASKSGSVECMLQAMEFCNGLARDKQGAGAMVNAASSGSVEAISWLAANGGLDFRSDDEGRGPMHHAARSGKQGAAACLKVLADLGCRVDERNICTHTPLMEAAKAGDARAVQSLLDLGADACQVDDSKMSALMHAAAVGSADAMRALLPHSDKMARDADQWTALHFAAQKGSVESVMLLARADMAAMRDEVGETPLIFAASRKHFSCVAELVKWGSIDVRDCDGDTALTGAAKSGCAASVGLLLEKGADPLAQNKNGHTALMEACRDGHLACVELLIPYGGFEKIDKRWMDALMNACAYGDLGCIESVSSAMVGLDPALARRRSKNGRGAMHYFASRAEGEVSAKLAALCGVDQADEDGLTPLMLAAHAGHSKKIESLMEAGANVEAKDQNGFTALMWAVRGNEPACARILAKKADILAVDELGRCVADYAAKTGKDELAGWLRELHASKVDALALGSVGIGAKSSAFCAPAMRI